jgi:hypothetical protein
MFLDTNKANEYVYCHVRGSIIRILKKFLQESPDLAPIIILTILFLDSKNMYIVRGITPDQAI